ncbi:hypothetical protein Dimus_027520 [Dionaea muscipula]
MAFTRLLFMIELVIVIGSFFMPSLLTSGYWGLYCRPKPFVVVVDDFYPAHLLDLFVVSWPFVYVYCLLRMNKRETGMASSSKVKFHEREDEGEVVSSEEDSELERELADVPFGELQKLRSDGTLAFHQKVKSSVKRNARANKNREELQKLIKSSKDPKVSEELIEKQLKSDAAKHTEVQILAEHKKREREAAKQGKRPFYLKKSEIRKQKLIGQYDSLKAAGKIDSYIDKRRRRNAAKDHKFMPYRRQSNEHQE